MSSLATPKQLSEGPVCFNPMCEDQQNNTHEERTGLAFLPFDSFGFIDCSIDRINRPFSGPAGDYEGAG
ncbi:hypothetical protein ACHAXM_001014 [Skeletonema potamos]